MGNKKPIKNNLKYYREKAGYTQAQVAAILSMVKNNDSHKLPNNLRYYREKQGLSLEEVANKIGVNSPKTIEKWENSQAMPKNTRHVFMMAMLYKTTMTNLYEKMHEANVRDIAKAKKALGLK